MDYGAKVAKQGFDAREPLTEQNKKNFIILNSAYTHKIIFANFVSGGSYDHNLGYVPFFLSVEVDSIPTASYYASASGRVTENRITGLPTKAYLIIFNEGNK